MSRDKLIGSYSFNGEKTIDSIVLNNNNTYTHKLYTRDLKLMYEANNNWEYSGNRIILYGFYNNADNLLTETISENDVKEFLMIMSIPIYRKENRVVLEMNSDEEILYKKNKE